MTAWAAIITRFLGSRSASVPAHADSSRAGVNMNPVSSPRAVMSRSVSSTSTSQAIAVRTIQVPTFETSTPTKYRR